MLFLTEFLSLPGFLQSVQGCKLDVSKRPYNFLGLPSFRTPRSKPEDPAFRPLNPAGRSHN